MHTSVVVPSLSFRQDELAKITAAPFYEERLLFTLMRLRDPRARVLYLTSQPIHPQIVDYYLQLLVGVPAGHARDRLLLLCAYDASPRSLTEKLLERPRLLARIRRWVGDPGQAYLTCFMATAAERQLPLELGIPLNGADPDHLWIGTKSGSRRIFATAEVGMPEGTEGVHSEDDVLDALERLARTAAPERAMIKLDDCFSGTGNAVLELPRPAADGKRYRRELAAALRAMRWSVAGESWSAFSAKLEAMGGVVEELVEAPEIESPSVQLRITPLGELQVISTHDQVLGGELGQMYQGCRFPADVRYRGLIEGLARRVGTVLAEHGVVSRFGVDFLAHPTESGDWRALGVEINLRMGGTTPPFLALQFLTGGETDADGEFRAATGARKYYRATDSLSSPSYRGLLADDLIDILGQHTLSFRPQTETGVLFHMIGALSQHGKVGVTCIGDSREEADALFERTREVLDAETGGEAATEMPLVDVVQME